MKKTVHVPESCASNSGGTFKGARPVQGKCARRQSIWASFKSLAIGIFAAAVLLVHPTEGNTFTDRAGITWQYELIGRNATLTAIAQKDAYDYITIPSKVDGYTVVALGARLFFNCGEITGVSIPYGVREIGNLAFCNCYSLEEVVLPYGVSSLGDQVFFNCFGLTEITLPATLEKIGLAPFGWTSIEKFKVDSQNQFYAVKDNLLCDKKGKVVIACPNALNATVVTVPSGVEEIGDGAFFGCDQLSRVVLPSSVKTIGRETFGYCENLQSIGLVSGLKTIGDYAFEYCSGLSSVTIPSGVTKIGDGAFQDCSGLTSVSIPDSVVEVGAWVFENCNSTLFDRKTIPDFLMVDGWIVGYENWNPYGNLVLNKGRGIAGFVFNNTGLSKVTINVPYKGIGKGAFTRCSDLFAVDVKSTLNFLGDGAFYECTSLDSVSLPSGITYMGKEAFGGCWDLKNDKGFIIVNNVLYGYEADDPDPNNGKVSIPSGVTRISKGAFYGDSGLRSVVVPDSVKTIDVEAFAECSELQRIQIGKGATDITWFDNSVDTKWCDDWFNNAVGRIREPRSFCDCEKLGSVEISAQNPAFKTIDDFVCDKEGGSLLYCPPMMLNVVTPKSVRNIAPGAFYRSFNISGLAFGGSVTNIGRNAFQECYYLTNVELPVGLITIDQYAFNWCEGLENIRIPHTVKYIGYGAFRGCTSLEEVLVAETIDEDVIDLGAAFLDFDVDDIEYYKLTYKIVFHRYDGSADTTETIEVNADETIRLTSLNRLGWARRGYDFKGWATSRAKADSGTIWKLDWAKVTNAIAIGKTLHIYAVWAVASDSYAIYFVRNDGAGTWRTIGFKYGVSTAIPTIKALGWARRGYVFKGWSLTTADARNNKVWKVDGAKIATAAAKGKILTVYASWAIAPDYYAIQFNKNDGSGKWRSVGFKWGENTKLPTLDKGLGWDRSATGYAFVGWSTNPKGSIWKGDGAVVASPVAKGKVLQVYALWTYVGVYQVAAAKTEDGGNVSGESNQVQSEPTQTATQQVVADGAGHSAVAAGCVALAGAPAADEDSLTYLYGALEDGTGQYWLCLWDLSDATTGLLRVVIEDGEALTTTWCDVDRVGEMLLLSTEDGDVAVISSDGTARLL